MRYGVETDGKSYTEILEVDGKKYTKKWIKSDGVMRTADEDFSVQLEADEADEQFAESVCENIDNSLFGYDFYRMFLER